VAKLSPFIGASQIAIFIGFIICISANSSAVVYIGMFFATAGVYGAHLRNISWVSNNLAPNAKRAAGIGIHFAGGNLVGCMCYN
jgi:hypothetical protein